MSVFHGQDVGSRGDETRARLKPMCLLARRAAGRLMRLLQREFIDCTSWGRRTEKTAGEKCIINVTVVLSNIHSRGLWRGWESSHTDRELVRECKAISRPRSSKNTPAFPTSPLPHPSHFDRRAGSEVRVHRLREEVNCWRQKTEKTAMFPSLWSRVRSSVDLIWRKGCNWLLIYIFIKDWLLDENCTFSFLKPASIYYLKSTLNPCDLN